MNRLLRLARTVSVALALGVALSAQASPSMPAQIAGLDLVSGKDRAVKLASASKASVVLFLSAKCPCSASHELRLGDLAREFEPKGFEFVGVHSNADEPVAFSEDHFRVSKLPFPVIQDNGARLADRLGAFKTPHVFVYGHDGTLLYQGGVDETHNGAVAKHHYLREALEAINSGQKPPRSEVRVLGCAIKRP